MADQNDLIGRRFIIPVDKRGRIVLPPQLRRELGAPCRVALDLAGDGSARMRVVAPGWDIAADGEACPDDQVTIGEPNSA